MKKGIYILICVLIVVVGIIIGYFLVNNKNQSSTFNIELNGSSGTPYAWSYSISDDNIVKYKEEKTIESEESKSVNEKIVGGQYTKAFVFETIKEGKTTIRFEKRNHINNELSEVKEYEITVDKNLKSHSKLNKETELKDYVVLGEETWIKQLQNIEIFHNENDTFNYFKITEEVKWTNSDGSFSIKIPYKFVIKDKEYKGYYNLGQDESPQDDNPKYDLKILDLTKHGEMKIIINEKST